MRQACTFCEIVGRRAPADIVFETSGALCIVPREMEVRGHLLVLPKPHHETVLDLPDELLAEVMFATKRAFGDVRDRLGATGMNLLHASGRSAQQSVPHFRLHLLPRFADDGVDAWPTLPGCADELCSSTSSAASRGRGQPGVRGARPEA